MTTTPGFRIATASAPGAVALIELTGAAGEIVARLTGAADWPAGVLRYARLGDIDEGVAGRVSDDLWWIMPHGGPRVLQRLAQRLADEGARPVREIDPTIAWPEAESRDEALALAALGRAASPLAVDLLLDQPRRWAQHRAHPVEPFESMAQRSRMLDRLLDPPLVVLAGRPNVGKSTLSNSLLGRRASIESEEAGTTRDYVVSRLDLAGLVVHWCDTPGRRDAADPIEREAIALAADLIHRADCLIAAAAPEIDWPSLDRKPDRRVLLKADLEPPGDPTDASADLLRVSARTGAGLAGFVSSIREALVPIEALNHPGPWLFDQRLSLT